jgi:acyl carrier protein
MELEMLKSAIVKVLKIDLSELDLETRFVEDLGADSLDMYQIAMNLEETFDVSFNETDLKQVVTVNDAYELLKNFKE